MAPLSPDRYTRYIPPQGSAVRDFVSNRYRWHSTSRFLVTGDSPVRRFAMTALTLSLMLGLSQAQEPKKDEPKPETAKPAEARQDGRCRRSRCTPRRPRSRVEAPKPPAEAPAADGHVRGRGQASGRPPRCRRADRRGAGGRDLVETTRSTRPPSSICLVQGYAVDRRDIKATPMRGVSPEVFAAWFTGWNSRTDVEGVNYVADLRIVHALQGPPKVDVRRSVPGSAQPAHRHGQARPSSTIRPPPTRRPKPTPTPR